MYLSKISENSIELDYNSEINTMLNESSQSGKKIPVSRIYRGLYGLRDELMRLSDEPQKVNAAFKQVEKQWKAALDIDTVRTPQEVQKIKTRI